MPHELPRLRTPYSATWELDDGNRQFVSVLGTCVHNDDGSEIDFSLTRMDNDQLDGWHVVTNDVHYALGKPNPNEPDATDGWFGYGGRKGEHWLKWRLLRVGYLHWPTRTWQDIGSAPTYDRDSLSHETEEITIGPIGAQRTIKVLTKAEWKNIWSVAGKGIDIRWGLEIPKLKEEVVIPQDAREWIATNRPPTTPAADTWFGFVFRIDPSDIDHWVQAGELLNIDGDNNDDVGAIEARNAANDLLAVMPISYAYVDTGTEIQRVRLRKRIWKDGNNYYLLVGARVTDLAALPAGDLVFDPTYSSQAPSDDAHLDSYNPDSNLGGEAVLGVYPVAGWSSVFKFDLSGIPASPTVSDGILSLWTGAYSQGSLTDVFVHRILPANSTWIEAQATWNHAHEANATRWAGDTGSDGGADAGCSVAGTDYHATDMFTGTLSGVEDTQNDLIDADAAARTEIENMIAANHGMVVWKKAAEAGNYIYLRSSEYGTAAERPKLVIEYTVAGGETFYQAITGTFASIGVLTKKTKTPKAGAITMSGTVIGKAKKVLTGAFTSSGALLGKAKKVLAGTITSSGALAKKTSKIFAGTFTSAGALLKKSYKIISGAITFVGTSLRTMKFARTILTGAITFSGAVVKKTKRTLTGALTSSGVLVSKAKKLLAGSITPSGISTKKTSKSFAGTLTYAGTLTMIKVFHRILTGAITFTGTITRKTGKVLTGAVTLAGAVSKLTRKILSGALTFIGRVTGLAPVEVIHLTLYDRSTDLTLDARSTDLTLEPRSTDLTLPSR